ncbi:MAG: hypothetical protein Q8O59_03050 [bacterium]|nr:hypothetical protein [bacterium]
MPMDITSQVEGLWFEPIFLPIGTQPLGICALGNNRFAIAGYFEPCIFIGEKRNDRLIEVDVIRFALHDGQPHRIFPPNAQPGGANRCQTVNPGLDGTLIITCNASRTFYVLAPPTELGGQWTCIRQFDLPEYPVPGYRYVHSAHFGKDRLTVTTSVADLNQPWEVGTYALGSDFQLEYQSHRQLPMSYVYGIGFRPNDPEPWFITDSRTNGWLGIFRDPKAVMPVATGNGICFLEDGSALVTRYGQEHRHPAKDRKSFGGNTGCLIYVHHSVIDQALAKVK